MSKTPPDQEQRERALDPTRSILVQAPAGSGKTDLLTRRFLRLLAEVDDPSEIVAITFTIAAAAEMRHRILGELEKAAESTEGPEGDAFAMATLARRALDRSNAGGWKLLDLPAQLRISTIDAFCRELALQQPLLSGLGGGLDVVQQPEELYRRAARQTLEQIENPGTDVGAAVARLLDWDDNNWQELEGLLVEMLGKRDRWMHGFLLNRDADEDALREYLERPFARAVLRGLEEISGLLDRIPQVREEALQLARFACSQTGGELHRELAELAEFPRLPFSGNEAIEEGLQALLCLANLVLTKDGGLRRVVDKRLGFPVDRKAEKARILALIEDVKLVPGLETAFAAVRGLPPLRYSEPDWEIVKASFTLLRHAVAQLRVVFAETASVDFTEVAQIAQGVLKSEDGLPSDAAIVVADGIKHLLVDEFQDTSRRQHQLLTGIIGGWNDRDGRTLFAVGDPMQSIYFFRDADAELFARVKRIGLEMPGGEPLKLEFVPLSANFRTTPGLVGRLNGVFEAVFEVDDGSGVEFSPAEAARPKLDGQVGQTQDLELHLKFCLKDAHRAIDEAEPDEDTTDPQADQVAEIAELIRSHREAMEAARAAGRKYRIAVLGRAKKSLVPIAEALREGNERAADDSERIRFRAVELEQLGMRPEVLDALALGRALLNPLDRVAWLGVLRAPWCGLSLEDLYKVAGEDDGVLLSRPVPELLASRIEELSEAGRAGAKRVLSAVAAAPTRKANQLTAALGTWLEQVWLSLGGADCCDRTALANLDMLWNCLDRLPEGEQDLIGPALETALKKLTALPDPAASTDWGVQLMTIHKSKGLEFEVVIVPDLQARTGGGGRKLLAWLERGLDSDEESDEITEFLVAPMASKGEDSGASKKWVDRVYRERESQETRRILYVAATRAREELHVFARLQVKAAGNGEFALVNPAASLLGTAWPGLEADIEEQFAAWRGARLAEAEESEGEIGAIAASGGDNLLVMPSAEPPAKPTFLRRLPEGYVAPALGGLGAAAESAGVSAGRLYSRHEGGVVSRALGTAVHSMMEELARLRMTLDWAAARAGLERLQPRIAAEARGAGIGPAEAAEIAEKGLRMALDASLDPVGAWILSPHVEAESEACWSGVVGGQLTTVRVDRVFRAGLAPGSEGDAAWWIVDYKTAHADSADPALTLPALRPLFAPQIEAYARVLRNLHGADAVVRAGLYYPRMLLLDWWEL